MSVSAIENFKVYLGFPNLFEDLANHELKILKISFFGGRFISAVFGKFQVCVLELRKTLKRRISSDFFVFLL